MTASKYWIADTPISMPQPPTEQRPVVHVFEGTGFGLTTYGITVALSDADRDEMLSGSSGHRGRLLPGPVLSRCKDLPDGGWEPHPVLGQERLEAEMRASSTVPTSSPSGLGRGGIHYSGCGQAIYVSGTS
jgi:hypothetical protein